MNVTRHRRHAYSRSMAVSRRIESAALYGAFGLIAAIVFSTLSVHPF